MLVNATFVSMLVWWSIDSWSVYVLDGKVQYVEQLESLSQWQLQQVGANRSNQASKILAGRTQLQLTDNKE